MIWNEFAPGHWMFGGPVLVIVIIFACVVLMMFMMRGRHGGERGDAAAQILKERFARGEIDKTEYEERRRALKT